jgi:O-antigen ligase
MILASVLLGYGLLFATYPIAQSHQDLRDPELVCVVLAGVLGLAHWLGSLFARSVRRPPWRWAWLAALTPAYALLQVIPLPLGLVRILSPNRARIADLAATAMPTASWAPLSVAASETFLHCLLLTACAVVFLVICDIGSHLSRHPWAAAAPLLIFAAAEACLGLVQVAENTSPNKVYATGTFPIRNHFAGFLEMVLPFAALAGPAILSRRRGETWSALTLLRASISFGAAALIFIAILASESRMGFVSTFAAVLFVSLASLARGRSWRRIWPVAVAVALVVLLAIMFLPSRSMVERLSAGDPTRPAAWRDTVRLIGGYPLFGCGLGGFAAAFTQYKASNFANDQDYAHNDYLQYGAELGLAGYAIAAATLAAIFVGLWKSRISAPEIALLRIACTGSVLAILLHSAADFNLYIPANMLTLGWVCGIAAYCATAAPRPLSKGETEATVWASASLGQSRGRP